jgi:hypothetical protein
VDDDPDNARSFALALEDDGFIVDMYYDPLIALSKFKADLYTCGFHIGSIKCAYICRECGTVYASKDPPNYTVFPTGDPRYNECAYSDKEQIYQSMHK